MKSILDTLHKKLKFTRKMLSEIQQERSRKLLCIFDINFAISTTTCYFVHKALCEIRPVKKLDVFLESGGGHLDDGFKLSRLLRAYSPSFSTLIAFRARSAALFTVLSSREILMHKSADIGSVRFINRPSNFHQSMERADQCERRLKYLEEVTTHFLRVKRESLIHYFLCTPHDYPISREKAKSLGLPVFFPDTSLSCKLSRLHQAYTDTLLAHGIHSALIIQHEEGLYLTLPAHSPKTATRPQHVSRAVSLKNFADRTEIYLFLLTLVTSFITSPIATPSSHFPLSCV